MAYNKFSADIIRDILRQSGEKDDGSSQFQNRALEYLNRAYQELWSGGSSFVPITNPQWDWLRSSSPGLLVLEPAITAGTVAVTLNDGTVTFSSAPAPAASVNGTDVTGWFLKVGSDTTVYRLKTKTSSTVYKLDTSTVYTGSTNAAATYTLFKLEYTLATGLLKIMHPMRVFTTTRGQISRTDIRQLDDNYPISNITAKTPYVYANISDSLVRFNSYPAALQQVEYDYFVLPAELTDSETEEPLVPRSYRYVLSAMSTMFLLQDKQDNRASSFAQIAQNGIQAMIIDYNIRPIDESVTPGELTIRPGQVAKNVKRIQETG